MTMLLQSLHSLGGIGSMPISLKVFKAESQTRLSPRHFSPEITPSDPT